jgi:DNA-binding response OmpR family regulator
VAPTVLVVDDDPVIRRLLRVNFEMEDFTVVEAGDGVEALAAAKKQLPDVIVSDVMMPRMDGVALVAALRADPDTKDVPVLLLSAKAQAADVAAGKGAGADDYVTKPFEPLDLVDRVRALLKP